MDNNPEESNKRGELHRVDDLENSLYSRKGKQEDVKIHEIRKDKAYDLPKSWADSTPDIFLNRNLKSTGVSFGMKVFFISVFLLIIALFYTGWRMISYRSVVSSDNIDLVTNIKPYVEGGEITDLSVDIHNRNNATLQNAVLTISYNKGIGAQDQNQMIFDKREIGQITANDYQKNNFQVQLYGAEADVRNISAKLEYQIAGASATFSKTSIITTILKTPPVSLSIDGPDTLSQGQNGDYKLTIQNNTSTTTDSFLVSLSFPTNFNLTSVNPKPINRNNVWQIDNLQLGQKITISFSGSFDGNTGENMTIKALSGSMSSSANEIGVVYSSYSKDITLKKTPLSLSVSLDSGSGGTNSLKYGDKPTLVINYSNNASSTLTNLKIVAHIYGDAPIADSITADGGYFDSSKQTITWDHITNPELSSIGLGGQGTLRFYVPVVSKGNSSPALKLDVTGIANGSGNDDVTASLSKSWNVLGTANINGWVSYTNSPFKNSGPIPPVPNKDTTYTLHIIASAQNAITNGRVTFILPYYVSWMNVFSNNQKVVYDEKNKIVIWSVGDVGAGTSKSIDIQVSVRPSVSQVASSPNLTSSIALEADEVTTQAHVKTTLSPLNTVIYKEDWQIGANTVSSQ